MNIREKVSNLVRYCGGYEGHSFMVDERNSGDFNIELPEEKKIRENLEKLRFILLTGEAGDGKTRMLKNLSEELTGQGFEICMDFSELDKVHKVAAIDKLANIIDGKSEGKFILAANIGIFTKTVLQLRPDIIKKLRIERDDILIINFERRNLAADKDFFHNLVTSFLKFDRECACDDTECPWKGNCLYRLNMINLVDKGLEGLRVLCDAVCLTGGHITFRELLSLVSYMVTFGQDCEKRRSEKTQGELYYYQIFNIIEDPRLQKFCSLDPAKARAREVNKHYHDREECIRERRKSFFEDDIKAEEKYALLYADYLKEFYSVLKIMNTQIPYYFSTIDNGVDENLIKLKMGLSKITRAGNTNLKMTVADTPNIFDGSIQTEFDINSNIETVWKRYDLDLQNCMENNLSEGRENRFFLSYVYPSEDGKSLQEISMLIDYPLFRFLLFAADDYHMDRTGISIEEYAVNTFYRKVLRSMPNAYHKAHVRFDEMKKRNLTNFSLELKSQNSLLFGNKSIVMIEKESEA